MKEFFWVEELAVGHCLSLENIRGWRIECEMGQVWLTESGRTDDIFIAKHMAFGQSVYEVKSAGHIVIEALPGLGVAARLRICPPASWVQRIWRRLQAVQYRVHPLPRLAASFSTSAWPR